MKRVVFSHEGIRLWGYETRNFVNLMIPFLQCVLIALYASACSSPDIHGKEAEVVIGSEIVCPSCSIAIDSIATLSDVSYGGRATAIARDTAGFTYILDTSDRLQLKVFGEDGHFVRKIGRLGAAPGEYEAPTNVVIRDSVVHVLDRHLARHSKFTRRGAFIESALVPRLGYGVGAAVILRDGRLVLGVDLNTPDPDRALLQVVDKEGHTTTLGRPIQDPNKLWRHQRHLWARANGGLLVADPFTATIEVLDDKLTTTHQIKRDAGWIPPDPPAELSDGRFDKPASAQLRSIWEDDEGILWLTMIVPSPDWRPEPQRPIQDPDEAAALVKRPRVDTLIEAIDLDRGNVLARLRLPGAQGAFFSGGFLARHVEDESLVYQVQVSRVRLRR